MKISRENKEEIQWFVYFLFKGTLNPTLIAKGDYIGELIDKPERLAICFEVFAESKSKNKSYQESVEDVARYIISSEYKPATDISFFWKELIHVSKVFCHTEFEFPIESFNLLNLNGCGSDAVPYFSVWTNTIEIDDNGCCINSEMALKRANERLLLWDSQFVQSFKSFSKNELEQEIY